MRAQLRKPGACGVLSLEVKYDPAFRLKCTGTLIIDDIQHSRKSCHDEYEFKTVPFTIPCCKLHFYHPKLLHIKLQFSKRNKQTPLLPLPEINSIYHAESAGSRDQPRPGSYLKKREEPGNEVAVCLDFMTSQYIHTQLTCVKNWQQIISVVITADSGRPFNANSCRVSFNSCTMTFLGRFSTFLRRGFNVYF